MAAPTTPSKYAVHPAANTFPMMTDEEYQGLKEDIRLHGQRESVVFWCNQLIDGRNRMRACQELGIEPNECELDADQDPVAYVISHNLHRRHLTSSQRGMVASTLATLKPGDVKTQKSDGQICPSIAEAAKQLNVSIGTVKAAKKVHTHGTPALAAMVLDGKISVDAAAKVAKKPNHDQEAIVSKGPLEVKRAARAATEELQWVDVDDETEQPPTPKSTVRQNAGCRKCNELKAELKRAQKDLKEVRVKYSDLITTCSEQISLINQMIDAKEVAISATSKPSTKKPKHWRENEEVVVK